MDSGLEAVLCGAGISYLYEQQARPWLESGQLVSMLEEWLPEPEQWQLYYPNRQYMTCGLRACLDYIKSPLPTI